MAQCLETIDPPLSRWLSQQRMFFVGTAPLSTSGHVNVSPKGGDSFRVLGPRQVAYCDYTGSGIETAAHLQENGRIVIMFCAFEGPPRIVRLHGSGRIIRPEDDAYATFLTHFPVNPGTRLLVVVEVTRIASSCGFSVPLYSHVGNREVLDDWAAKQGPEGLQAYRRQNNNASIDGLPGI